ncbi:MAG: CopG family antitoxin [Candidatus Bipolaricaulia bacterium]
MSKSKPKPKPKSQGAKKLPDMTSWTDEQIARFWETHSTADYWDELEPVEVELVRPEKEVVALRLDKPLLEQVKAIAAAKSLGYTTLLRVWIKEKLIEVTVMKQIRLLVADVIEQIVQKQTGELEVAEIDARVEPYSELVKVTVRFTDGGEPLYYKLHPSQLVYDAELEERVERDLLQALKKKRKTGPTR